MRTTCRGTTLCGEATTCSCEDGEWQITYVTRTGCPDAAVPDAMEPDAATSDAAPDDASPGS